MNYFYNIHPLIIILVLAWSLAWKGAALWKAARNAQKGWFVALLVINTLGILDILYIYLFGNRAEEKQNPPQVNTV